MLSDLHIIGLFHSLLAALYISLAYLAFQKSYYKKRNVPIFVLSFLCLSSLLAVTILIKNQSLIGFGNFISYHILLMANWYLFSFNIIKKHPINDRHHLNVQGKILDLNGESFQLVNISSTGCLIQCEAGLDLKKDYCLQFYCNNKEVSLFDPFA